MNYKGLANCRLRAEKGTKDQWKQCNFQLCKNERQQQTIYNSLSDKRCQRFVGAECIAVEDRDNANYQESTESRLTPEQTEKARQYVDLVIEVNQMFNLTSNSDPDIQWRRFIVESMAIIKPMEQLILGGALSRPQQQYAAEEQTSADDPQDVQVASNQPPIKVLDVGTGAGCPGMAIAIAKPEWEVHMIDGTGKKANFVREAIRRIGITNARVQWARAEEVGHEPEMREQYDFVVSRAVAKTQTLVEYCLPFVRPGGMMVALKGTNPKEEVITADGAISELNGELLGIAELTSPAYNAPMSIVVIKKGISCPQQYPRAPSQIKQNPLF